MPFITTVITGATSGIGRETALALAQKGHAVYMLVRDMAKGEVVKQEIIELSKNKNVYLVECDLANLKSVENAASLLKNGLMAVNVLINNAGGIFADRSETRDGNEMTFSVNHLGHFLLVQSLMPALQKGQARIINVSSDAHRMAKPNFRDLQWAHRPYSAIKAYADAKLYNIYFTQSLETKYGPKGITAFSLHPGLVNTAFGAALTGFNKTLMWLMRPFMISAEVGARTTVHLATANRLDASSGKYFKNMKLQGPSALALNEGNRNKLWDISMQLVQPYLNL